jgi:hypothetical protein
MQDRKMKLAEASLGEGKGESESLFPFVASRPVADVGS